MLKEHSCKWLVSAYDYIRSYPDIIVNGFRKAGIIDALENELPAPDNLAIEDDRILLQVVMNRWNRVLSHTRTCFRHTLWCTVTSINKIRIKPKKGKFA